MAENGRRLRVAFAIVLLMSFCLSCRGRSNRTSPPSRFLFPTVTPTISVAPSVTPTLGPTPTPCANTFRGLCFGVDIRQQLPKCDYSIRGQGACWSERGEIDGEPYYSVRFNDSLNDTLGTVATVMQVDDGLGWLSFSYAAFKLEDIAKLLIAKFGKPGSSTTRPWQSKGGAKTTALSIQWHVRRLRIYAAAPSDEIDRGTLTVTTDEYLDHSERVRQKKQQRGVKDL